jgi:competence protein ComEA
MRPRSSPPADAVARRLELLRAELAPEPDTRAPDLHTHIRPAPVEPEPPAPALLPVPGRHAARRRGAGLRLPEGLSRWSAGGVALGPGPVAVVAVLIALGLALCCWWLLRSDSEPVAAAAPHPGLATPVPVGSSPGPVATEIIVDVAGKVRRPGIAVLEPGARVVDAIRAAGGARRGADLTGLNLARLLVDGEQIIVGVPPPPGLAASAAATPGAAPGGPLVHLNTATVGELEELPGVGPVTAEAIVAFRTEHGAFTSVDELLDVSGIGEATLAEIAPHATV